VISHGIDALYFDFQPLAGHAKGCPRQGTDVWETTRYRLSSFRGDKTETTIRIACRSCGVVHFERADSDLSTETTHASQIGYGGEPEKVAGVWLWPGPRIWYGDDRGPQAYLITAGKETPRQREDVLGIVGWHLGKRGGIRWSAGLRRTDHCTVLAPAGKDFGSRRAAVAWVVATTSGGAE
jgi:hypothetical protein